MREVEAALLRQVGLVPVSKTQLPIPGTKIESTLCGHLHCRAARNGGFCMYATGRCIIKTVRVPWAASKPEKVISLLRAAGEFGNFDHVGSSPFLSSLVGCDPGVLNVNWELDEQCFILMPKPAENPAFTGELRSLLRGL